MIYKQELLGKTYTIQRMVLKTSINKYLFEAFSTYLSTDSVDNSHGI